MNHTPRLERKRTFRISSNNEVSSKPQHSFPHRPSFAARMFKLIFTRGPSPDKSRPKSWSGEPEPASTATTETLVRHSSVNAIIPSGSESTVRPALGLFTSRKIHEESGDEDDKVCDASWRQRQTHCVNCERLFFVSLSTLSCGPARFCSLDCKTSFEYVNHLEEVLAVHMLGDSATSMDSLDSSSDEDEYEVEEFDVDHL